MVFGSGNKFRIKRSQSKASYLAYRREPREREKGLPNFEGSYKRTMSPSGRVKSPLVENSQVSPTPTSPPSDISSDKPTIIHRERNSSSSPPVIPPSEPSPPSNRILQTTSQLDVPRAVINETQSKTLPRNYIAQEKRVSRTPRTQSDPLNMPVRLAEISVVDTQSHLSQKNNRIPRSRSDISNAGSNESGYSSSSLNVSSPASSPTRTPVDLDRTVVDLEQTNRYRIELDQINRNRTIFESNEQNNRTCVEIQCNLDSSPKIQCTSESYRTSPASNQRVGNLSRINSSMNDASCQTEQSNCTAEIVPDSIPYSRQMEEEIECEKLSRDLASQLPPDDRLHGILVPGPEVKKRTDYVSGLFRMDVTPRSKSSSSSSQSSDPSSPKETKNGLSESSAYFASSECKAKLLALVNNQNQTDSSMNSLQQKKAELMTRIDKKLAILREEQVELEEESRLNDQLGDSVATRVTDLARSHESAKFRLHVQEVGHITSLLLGLSGRLARAENALIGLPSDHCDRKSLEEKRDILINQLEEAKELKENIDKRSTTVATLLRKYLSPPEFDDYNHFINMKAKLLVDSREVTDKIQLGEQQLAALKQTLNETS